MCFSDVFKTQGKHCIWFSEVRISSVQDSINALRKAHMRSTRSLSGVFPTLPLKQFQCSSDWQWSSLVRSSQIVLRFLFPRLSPSCDRRCDALGFVPAGSVSSTSTLQIFRDTSHMWWCPPVHLLCYFPSLRHVQGSTYTGNFDRMYLVMSVNN